MGLESLQQSESLMDRNVLMNLSLELMGLVGMGGVGMGGIARISSLP